MSTVVFTQNVTPENRNAGLDLLGRYWRTSVISKAPYYPIATTFDGMTEWMDSNYPTFIEWLGEQTTYITVDKVRAAVDSVAAKGLTAYPSPSQFANAIAQYGGTIDYGEILSETADDVGNSIASAASGVVNFSEYTIIALVVVAVIAVGLVIYTRGAGLKIPKLPKVAV